MEGTQFSTTEALRFGWNTFKANVWLIIKLMLISGISLSIPYALSFAVMENSKVLGSLCLIVYYALASVATVGYIIIGLKFVDGKTPVLEDLWTHWEQAGKWLWATFLFGLLTTVGFFLLIFPGVIFLLKYYFVPYLVVDKKLNTMEAFQMSAKMTDGIKLDLLGMFIVVSLVALAGYLVFFVGIFVSMPVCMLAIAYIYRTIDKQVNGGTTPVVVTAEKTSEEAAK